ncbi:alpha/beta fold hydrolase [Mediterraneibacter gnavus]|uniref:alpha/beta fold hydrolase n=1 Tax=Mediterraneibacter gnavus TaxID=33038 RepID=UPI0022E174C2|nr:alpha/beta fold hydrolase [Mediterraneibacter gnavus]
MKKILIHGSGHKAISWQETISYMKDQKDILCPDLCSILNGQDATYENLYTSFVEYCSRIDGQIHLVGLSLGGIIAMNYALDFPEKVKTLVVIGTPHKIPKVAFEIQNVIFRFFPKSVFKEMAFDKKDTFALGNSIKKLEIADRMQEIKCPVLVICGEKDCANKKSAYYFSENIENVALCMIEKTGHVVNEENPKELARILNEYYDGK